MPQTFHQLVTQSALKKPDATALQHKNQRLSYQQLALAINNSSQSFLRSGLLKSEKIAVYLPKQFEAVIALFSISAAGGVFVPINPLLKSPQVKHILQDCQVSYLVTSLSRYKQLKPTIDSLGSLKQIILTDCKQQACPTNCIKWDDFIQPQNNIIQNNILSSPAKDFEPANINAKDIAAILYTSGSTGQPKGVVLSHTNLVEGAKSVASYLNNTSQDKLLAVLPFSFDYGLSQLTTAFFAGACVVLLEYLLPRDVINAVANYKITGLAAVPALWTQLAPLDWPTNNLRYITNSGGAMPPTTLKQLQQQLPHTSIYLMYGLTEAFRSTYLEPSEIQNHPLSIGKAIPNANILVLNSHGDICQANEEGELVHQGVHVALGYWGNETISNKKFKPLPKQLRAQYGHEKVVWSGDQVVRDVDGFLYFIGRKDDMIKSSGYRISPEEIEAPLYSHAKIKQVAAIGVPHSRLGQAVVLIISTSEDATLNEKQCLAQCKKLLPNYMQPQAIKFIDSLPINANGKINRSLLSQQYSCLFLSQGS